MFLNIKRHNKKIPNAILKKQKKSFTLNHQQMDPFLTKSRNIYNFPSNNISSNFEMNTNSIHQTLIDYVNDVKSGGRGSFNKKIVDIKDENNFHKVNIMDIYKFNVEKEVINLLKEKFTCNEKKTLRIFFDGGCATQERLGFFGCAFYLENDNVLKIAGNIGPDNTNNTSEYTGLIMSLLFLHMINKKENLSLKVYSDSELVCKQMQGRYRTTTPHIIVLHSIAKSLFKNIAIKEKEISHIYREYNEEADYVGNHGKTLKNNSFEVYY